MHWELEFKVKMLPRIDWYQASGRSSTTAALLTSSKLILLRLTQQWWVMFKPGKEAQSGMELRCWVHYPFALVSCWLIVGSNSIIQDRAHLSREVTVGNNVYVGPNTVLQGSKLENRAFVGMGATVRHATVSSEAVVAAGAVVPDNTHIPSMQVWAGNPAQFIRNVTPIEKQILREYLEESQALARIHQ